MYFNLVLKKNQQTNYNFLYLVLLILIVQHASLLQVYWMLKLMSYKNSKMDLDFVNQTHSTKTNFSQYPQKYLEVSAMNLKLESWAITIFMSLTRPLYNGLWVFNLLDEPIVIFEFIIYIYFKLRWLFIMVCCMNYEVNWLDICRVSIEEQNF